jgi:hypothetical protein
MGSIAIRHARRSCPVAVGPTDGPQRDHACLRGRTQAIAEQGRFDAQGKVTLAAASQGNHAVCAQNANGLRLHLWTSR